MSDALDRLRSYLRGVLRGPIADPSGLDGLLAAAWCDIEEAGEKMAAYKLRGRMERVEWNPPVLTFMIERHGRTVLGSTRAELQQWIVNIDARTASCGTAAYRQLRKREPRMDVRGLAGEIGDLILQGRDDPRFKWSADKGKVRIVIGEIVPAGGCNQTVRGRRRRFSTELLARLGRGWRYVGWNEYRRDIGPEGRASS